MRYLLLSVFVVCVIGVMIPSAPGMMHEPMVCVDRNADGYCIGSMRQEDYNRAMTQQQNYKVAEIMISAIVVLAIIVIIVIVIIIGKSLKKGTPTFCKNCRIVLRPTSKFCPKCGNQI